MRNELSKLVQEFIDSQGIDNLAKVANFKQANIQKYECYDYRKVSDKEIIRVTNNLKKHYYTSGGSLIMYNWHYLAIAILGKLNYQYRHSNDILPLWNNDTLKDHIGEICAMVSINTVEMSTLAVLSILLQRQCQARDLVDFYESDFFDWDQIAEKVYESLTGDKVSELE